MVAILHRDSGPPKLREHRVADELRANELPGVPVPLVARVAAGGMQGQHTAAGFDIALEYLALPGCQHIATDVRPDQQVELTELIAQARSLEEREVETKLAKLKEVIRDIESEGRGVGDQRAREIVVHMDSELIAKQLAGEYRVKNEDLKTLFEQAVGMLKSFGSFEIKHIDRARNKDADKLVNKAINLAGLF